MFLVTFMVLTLLDRYLADNPNLSAFFRRRRPESNGPQLQPLACVPEINAARRTPQKPGPRLKRGYLATVERVVLFKRIKVFLQALGIVSLSRL